MEEVCSYPRTASGGNRHVHALISISPALTGAGKDERSIAALDAFSFIMGCLTENRAKWSLFVVFFWIVALERAMTSFETKMINFE